MNIFIKVIIIGLLVGIDWLFIKEAFERWLIYSDFLIQVLFASLIAVVIFVVIYTL